jgi:ABC-2 type transport system permease protein
MQWTTLFKKEMLESWRNKKWIWFPLVMILLAIMDPLTNYYLPQIIDATGGLPEGTTMELPDYTPPEVIMMSLGQFSSLGVLVIVLISMGTIAGERKHGISELILVKPVSYRNYITAKWVALLVLVWGSFLLGMFVSWYYITLLYGGLSLISLLLVVLFYGLWLTLVATVSIFFNTLFRSVGVVGFLSILTLMLMGLITKVFERFLNWSPIHLSDHIFDMLKTEHVSKELIATALITLSITTILLILSIFIFKKKEMAT